MPASPIQMIDLNAPTPDPQALTDSIIGYFADKDKKTKEKEASTALAKSLGIEGDDLEEFAKMDLGRQQLFIQNENQRELNLQRELQEVDRTTNMKLKAFDKVTDKDKIQEAIQIGEDRRNEIISRSLQRKSKTLDVIKGEEDDSLTETLRANAKEAETQAQEGFEPTSSKAKEIGGIAPLLQRAGTEKENSRRESNALNFAKKSSPQLSADNFKNDSKKLKRYLGDLSTQLKNKKYDDAQRNNILSQVLKSSGKDLEIANKLNANPDDPEAREELRQQYLSKKKPFFGKPTLDMEEKADEFADKFIKEQVPEINKFYSDPFIKDLLSVEKKELAPRKSRRSKRNSANDRTIQDLQKIIEEG